MHHLKIHLLFIGSLLILILLTQASPNFITYTYLKRIEIKLDELSRKLSTCGCNEKEDALVPSRESDHSITKRDTRSNFLRFNRLADDHGKNSIPSSSHQDAISQFASSNHDNNDEPALSPSERRILLHFEALFGKAFDNLDVIVKEQLVSFRLTLNKLTGRLTDHNYQHNVLSNQLSLLKDECSLAASYSSVAANFTSSKTSSFSNSSQDVLIREPATADQTPTPSAVRTSEASMIVRLVSDELNRLMRKNSIGSAGDKQEYCVSSAELMDEQERHLRQEMVLNGGVATMQKQLNEIDSVVKQTAKILANLPSRYDATDRTGASPLMTTIEISDGDQTISSGSSINSVGNSIKSTRWFSGSKVPNQRQGSSVSYDESLRNTSGMTRDQQLKRPPCVSKTNLVRPTSCEQLRQAGANCSGTYFLIFKGNGKRVYCDMSTLESALVALRRNDKSLKQPPVKRNPAERWTRSSELLKRLMSEQMDFNQDWQMYKSGFGSFEDWSEYFVGLEMLHATCPPPGEANLSSFLDSPVWTCKLDVSLTSESSLQLHLSFDNFSVGPESDQYRLRVGACNAPGELCEPITSLNMGRFFTYDKMANCSATISGNSSSSLDVIYKQPGWWLPVADNQTAPENCPNVGGKLRAHTGPTLRLTSQIGALANGQHLYWPNWSQAIGSGVGEEPLREVVLKVRRQRRARGSQQQQPQK